MKDIIPYEQSVALKLGAVLTRLGVPTVGPETGMALVRIVDGIDKAIEEKKITGDRLELLMGVRHRITDICLVSAGAQAEVLQTLEKYVCEAAGRIRK